MFNIPESVTQENLEEAFKEYQVTEMTYRPQSETGDERGGQCFFAVASTELGEKLLEDKGEECDINGHTVKLLMRRNKFWPKWTRSIFVWNLNWNTEEWHLDEYF